MAKRNRVILSISLWSIYFIALWMALSLLFGFIEASTNKQSFNLHYFSRNIVSGKTIIVTFSIFLISLAAFVLKYIKKPQNNVVSAKRAKSSLHDQSEFLNEDEINKYYGNQETKDYKRFSNISNEDVNGIVINSKEYRGDILFNSASDLHSLTLGTTGMGKTKYLLIPTVELMARSKTKPSMVILDVKGEIYERTNKNLSLQGYETHLVDLRNPTNSEKFNPFSLITYYWEEYLKNPKNLVAKEKTNDLILQICSMFNPKMKGVKGGGSGDDYWDNAAMSVMETYIWSLLENYQYCAYLRKSPFEIRDAFGKIVDEEKVNSKYADIAKSITGFGTRDGVTFEALQDIANLDLEKYYRYLNSRPHSSNTYKTAHETILNMITIQNGHYEMQKPLLSLLSVYKTNYKRVISETIEEISKSSSFNIREMYLNNTKPFALYILLPDEDKNKYPFASLMISEIYQFFTSLSQEIGFSYSSKRRNIHFFMDEFANLNPMEDIDNWLSVGRERKLFLHLFIQGLSQLNNKYGHDKAKTIIGNCNMKIFMALSENEAIDYAVKLFGHYTVQQTSKTTSSNNGNSTTSTNTSLGQANLINPSDIKQLPKGTIYFLETTRNPAKGQLLPSFNKTVIKTFGYNL